MKKYLLIHLWTRNKRGLVGPHSQKGVLADPQPKALGEHKTGQGRAIQHEFEELNYVKATNSFIDFSVA